jgi:hypothetical protein
LSKLLKIVDKKLKKLKKKSFSFCFKSWTEKGGWIDADWKHNSIRFWEKKKSDFQKGKKIGFLPSVSVHIERKNVSPFLPRIQINKKLSLFMTQKV